MKGIFENAYFGKLYKTRDGRKAIYIGSTYKNDHALHIDKNGSNFSNDIYNDNGKMVNNKRQADTHYDIVSEWKEEINETELDEMCIDYADTIVEHKYDETEWMQIFEAYKSGYRKAMEDKKLKR